jgi:hypothetical protein
LQAKGLVVFNGEKVEVPEPFLGTAWERDRYRNSDGERQQDDFFQEHGEMDLVAVEKHGQPNQG